MTEPRRVTALRASTRGRVAVELDGRPWRVLSLDAVAAAGLTEGCALDRERARRLARARRRADAVQLAARALAHRALSEQELDARLARRRVPARERNAAREVLASAGYVDDARLATDRAQALARRGAGDALIRHDLESRGVSGELVDAVLEALEHEDARARRVVASRGSGSRTARWLAARGFGEEAVETAIARDVAEGGGEVVG